MNEIIPSWEAMNNPPPPSMEMHIGTVIMLILLSLLCIEFAHLIIKGRSLGS